MHATLTPAYGRDYTSKAEIERDLLDGKDFNLVTFDREGLVNLFDLLEMEIHEANVRYGKLRKVAVFNLVKLGHQRDGGAK